MNAPVSTPTITNAPAPWDLQGRGYISMLRFSRDSRVQDSFLLPSLLGKRGKSPWGYMMFVDYSHSDVGPYHELLFIPGSFPFEDGRNHLSISRIFVSSMDSVVNGQRNWGIPKDVAEFDVQYGKRGVDRVTVSKDGKVFAELEFRHYPLWLPFLGKLIPKRFRTLGQHHEGKTFVYAPSASGWVQPARLVSARVDPEVFPNLGRGRTVLTMKVARFRMCFPKSDIISHR
ncbi:MAG TPA: acetoacetate decarboxylase family protein [Solimonas sp.]|nr:acetoacetate decarboxylase family protein [Solimonas sp.]